MQVVSQVVIFDDPPIFLLVGGDDGEITFIFQLRSVDRFSSLHVAGTLVQQNRARDAKPDPSVDAPLVIASLRVASLDTGSFRVVLKDGDFVPEELGSLASCMGNQGFLFGESELEFLTQKDGQLSFDLLCFCFGTDKSQGEVIGIATIVEPPIAGVLGVFGGEMLSRLAEALTLFGQAPLKAVFSLVHDLFIHWVVSSFLPSGVAGNEHGFDILIQFIEQDIAKDGRNNRTLCKVEDYAK